MSVWREDIKKHLATIDWFLVVTVFVTMVYGFLLIKSATNAESGQTKMLVTHIVASILGIICAAVLSKSDYDHITKYSRYLYIAGVVVLALTLLIGSGDEVGNRSWIRVPIPGLGTVGIQPSEIVKIAFILTIANLLNKAKAKETINSPKTILILVLHFAVIFGLILAAGDLGNNLMYGFIFLAMCFASGMSLWYFLAGIFVIVATSPLWWKLLEGYRMDRILVGFNPMLDPDGYGYQPLLSRRAIGSGGLFGAGYQNGYITQKSAAQGGIPVQWTDFIYSAAGEEFGFIGAMLVLLLLTMIIARIFIISRKARNDIGSLICVGVMSMFIIQTLENIGMCLAMLPVIGITLPFFSYGGSSILSSLLGIGVVLSVNSRKNIYYFTRDENIDKF